MTEPLKADKFEALGLMRRVASSCSRASTAFLIAREAVERTISAVDRSAVDELEVTKLEVNEMIHAVSQLEELVRAAETMAELMCQHSQDQE